MGFLVQSCPILPPTHSSVGENNEFTNLILDLRPSSTASKEGEFNLDGREKLVSWSAKCDNQETMREPAALLV